jgi:hypothetical protein
MPRGEKANSTDKRPAGAIDTGEQRKSIPRAQPTARGWPAANNLHGAGQNADARRKVPSGPLGGSGRKTNLSRSS